MPNVPEGPVSLAVADGRLEPEAERTLLRLGVGLIKTEEHAGVQHSISFHPDIMLHHLGEEYIVYAPGTGPAFLERLRSRGFRLIQGASPLAAAYPGDIPYNVARVGKLAFHNLRFTDAVVKKELEKRGVTLVNVRQGYSKCSVSIIGEKTIITSDRGIAKAAKSQGVEVLLIGPEPGIRLPGLSGGFIGGSSGLVGQRKWFVTGRPASLQSSTEISEFLTEKGVDVVFPDLPHITDIGSLLPLISSDG